MPPAYDPQYDIYHSVTNPAEQWQRDRGIISSWLKRQADTSIEGGERRQDGTSNAMFVSDDFGTVSVHDYWSFCRPDFNASARQQSYQEILARQEPILSFEYLRPDTQPPQSAQLVVFINGEMDVKQGYAETFARFTLNQPPDGLIAVETNVTTSEQAAVDLYHDPVFLRLLVAIRRHILRPPSA